MKTSRGYEVEFVGIATAMDELENSRPKIRPPTYRVEIPGTLNPDTGKPRFEEHEHDETTLTTDEEKAAYAEYLRSTAAEWAVFRERALKLTLLRGIKIETPDLTTWRNERKFLGLPLPDDPLEEKYLWIYTEVIGTLEDLRSIQRGVEIASGVSEEQIAATAALFRREVGESNGDETARPDDSKDEGDVVLQRAVRTGEGGDLVKDAGQRVRRAKSKR